MAHHDLPFEARLVVAGSIWNISSNCQELLYGLQELFPAATEGTALPKLSLRICVTLAADDSRLWDQPYFRALDHLYYASFGSSDSMLVDQRGCRVVGSFSISTARDRTFWRTVIVPVLMGISSSCLGVTPLHCACVATGGQGLLLAGESGAGKSTLALFLSLNGFSYLSDDCTYLSGSPQEMRAWGLPNRIKLLPEAVTYFPQLHSFEPAVSLNGELAFEVDPVEVFGVAQPLSCEPRWLLCLERTGKSGAEFAQIDSREMAAILASDLENLPRCIANQREHQLAMIETLVDRECWILRHGMEPSSLAPLLGQFCAR